MLPEKIAFVDVETTGGSLNWDRIIEIAIVLICKNRLTKKFHTVINPKRYVPQEILALTNIPLREIETAPTFGQIKHDVLALLEGYYFAAHNVRFDYGFIKAEFAREEITFKAKHFCTVRLSKELYPAERYHNLDTIIERHNLKCPNRHRALDDAGVLWQFYKQLKNSFPKKDFTAAFDRIIKKPSLPILLSQKKLDSLPETPGVYIFYGKEGMPLYIGKSCSIKDRVLSHFGQSDKDTTEFKIAQQVKSIETHKTTGELGALLLESELIKKMQPLYNRKLRNSRKLVFIKESYTEEKYLKLYLEESYNLDPNDFENINGIFKSFREAKNFLRRIAEEYHLCHKLMGLEKIRGACFGYQIERCHGACVKKEPAFKYNLRVREAFAQTKIAKWPFESPIIITEKETGGRKSESYLFNNWCFLGKAANDGHHTDIEEKTSSDFNLDVYKILNRYLKNSKNWKTIKQLKGKTYQRDLGSLQ